MIRKFSNLIIVMNEWPKSSQVKLSQAIWLLIIVHNNTGNTYICPIRRLWRTKSEKKSKKNYKFGDIFGAKTT